MRNSARGELVEPCVLSVSAVSSLPGEAIRKPDFGFAGGIGEITTGI